MWFKLEIQIKTLQLGIKQNFKKDQFVFERKIFKRNESAKYVIPYFNDDVFRMVFVFAYHSVSYLLVFFDRMSQYKYR